MNPPTLESRVAVLEAHREDDRKKLESIDRKLDDLIAAHERFRGAVRVAMWMTGIIGTIVGGVAGTWWKGGTP